VARDWNDVTGPGVSRSARIVVTVMSPQEARDKSREALKLVALELAQIIQKQRRNIAMGGALRAEEVRAAGSVAKAGEKPKHLKKVWWYDCNPPHYKFRDGKPIDYYQGDKRKARKYGDKGNKNDGTYVGPSQIIATPVFHEGRVYLAIGQDPAHGRGKGVLHCIDATKTGEITKTGKVWSYDGLDRSISTVAVADGLVYAPDIAGRLHCVDADTGKCYWVHETRHEAWGAPLVADGKVYFNTRRSFWILAAGKRKKVLYVERRVGSEASPVAANGVLYVVLKGWLWALRSAAP